MARTPARRALPAYRFNRYLNFTNAVSNPPPIGFQLLFAGPPGADAATQAGQTFAAAGQPRQQIIKLCEFDLQLAFPRPGMRGKDIENELCPVDDSAVRALLHISELHGSQIVIDDDKWHVAGFYFRANFIQFAATDERGWVEDVTDLDKGAVDGRARAVGQLFQFRKRVARRSERLAWMYTCGFLQTDANEQDSFAPVHRLRRFHPSAGESEERAVDEVRAIPVSLYADIGRTEEMVWIVSDCLANADIVGCSGSG